MFRLITSILLLLIPGLAIGQTVKLPAEIIATGKLVIVTPEYDPAAKLLATEFMVFGDRRAPEYATFGQTLIVGEPDQGDEITIVAVAMYDGPKLSKFAVTKVKPRKTSTTPPGTPGSPPGTPPSSPPSVPGVDRDIPPGVSGLHVVLVVDPANVPSDIASLARGENAVTKALAARKSAFYVRNSTDSLVAGLQASIKGKQLPALVVMYSTRQILAAESFAPTGNIDQTAKRIITQVANAVGK